MGGCEEIEEDDDFSARRDVGGIAVDDLNDGTSVVLFVVIADVGDSVNDDTNEVCDWR